MSADTGTSTPTNEPDSTPPFTPAWRSPKAWCVLLVVLFCGLALDLGTKSWSFNSVADRPVLIDRQALIENTNYQPIPPHDSVVFIPGRILNFHLVLNSGAVFGIGAHRRGFFIGFTIIAVGVCLWIFSRWIAATSTMAHIGIGLVLAVVFATFSICFPIGTCPLA